MIAAFAQQPFELVQTRIEPILAKHAGRALDLFDERPECGTGMVSRALAVKHRMRLGCDPGYESLAQVRLADARLAENEDDLSVTRSGARPAAHERVELIGPIDERKHPLGMACGKPAYGRSRSNHAPYIYRVAEPLDFTAAQVLALESRADQLSRFRRDQDRVRIGERLQTRREIERHAECRLLLGGALADRASHDDQAGGDTDANGNIHRPFGVTAAQRARRLDDLQGGLDGAFGVILMPSRVAEIGQQAEPGVLGDVSVEALDDGTPSAEPGLQQLIEIFRIERAGLPW